MLIQLSRYGSLPGTNPRGDWGIGTFGLLLAGSDRFETVEKPWNGNLRFKSCIPAGLYDLEPHNTPKYKNVWAMVSKELGVAHYDKSAARYACLIHIANFPENVSGCIGVGKRLGFIGGRLGVSNSTDSIQRLRVHLRVGEKHQINITWRNEENTHV